MSELLSAFLFHKWICSFVFLGCNQRAKFNQIQIHELKKEWNTAEMPWSITVRTLNSNECLLNYIFSMIYYRFVLMNVCVKYTFFTMDFCVEIAVANKYLSSEN